MVAKYVLRRFGNGMKQATLITTSREQTLALATAFSRLLKGGEIVFLRGPIGAG